VQKKCGQKENRFLRRNELQKEFKSLHSKIMQTRGKFLRKKYTLLPLQAAEISRQPRSEPGLPDGIFSNQKSDFG
jgi:hypothetical protein